MTPEKAVLLIDKILEEERNAHAAG